MGIEFPQLTSFGTLLAFAQALEETAAACSRDAGHVGAARTHDKRRTRLEQLRRERLNEVVLQPLNGMNRDDYLPADQGNRTPVARAIHLEETISVFYRDAIRLAAQVLGGLERTFERFAKESDGLAADGFGDESNRR